MIHEEIVGYDVAKLAKEKGFPQLGIDLNDYWFEDNDGTLIDMNVKAFVFDAVPKEGLTRKMTQSLLQRWLREEKKISVEVSWFEVGKKYFWVAKDMNNHDVFKPNATKCMTFYDTWEQALERGLEYALKELE